MSGNQQSQGYYLRWNNHQNSLLSVFEDLLSHEAFVDVTLAVEGLELKAHKMVLSACSPYFQSMLYNTSDRHPIVFIRDVRYSEMKALLEFMYRGEVSVDQENLSSLLKVAEGLKIKGLTEVQKCNREVLQPVSSPPSVSSSGGGADTSTITLSGSAVVRPLTRSSSPDHILPQKSSHLNGRASSILVNPPPLPSCSASNLSLEPKRRRGRPRKLSGCEDVPLALELSDTEDENQCKSKNDKELPEPSGDEDVVSSPISSKSPQTSKRVNVGKKGNNINELKSMSVRGLDLLRHGVKSRDGTYRCHKCEKLNIIKTFKQKSSFKRHIFLYHEGPSRKEFPCSFCHKKFSRPDKVKEHLRVSHDGVNITKNSSKNNYNYVEDLIKIDVSHPPATLSVDPFLQHLNDPTNTDGKIESCKDSGSRVQ